MTDVKQQYKIPPNKIPEGAACGNCKRWLTCGAVKGYLKINLIPQCWEPKKGFKRSYQYNTANRLKERGGKTITGYLGGKMEEKSKKSSNRTTGKIAKIRQLNKKLKSSKKNWPKNIPLKLMSTGVPVKRVLTEFKEAPLNVEYVAKRIGEGHIDFHGVDEGLCVGTIIYNKRTGQAYRICGIVHKVMPIGLGTKKNKKRDTFLVISPAYKGPGK